MICRETHRFDSKLTVSPYIVWKVSKYGPEITPYLDTFHAVVKYKNPHAKLTSDTLFFPLLNEGYLRVFLNQKKPKLIFNNITNTNREVPNHVLYCELFSQFYF